MGPSVPWGLPLSPRLGLSLYQETDASSGSRGLLIWEKSLHGQNTPLSSGPHPPPGPQLSSPSALLPSAHRGAQSPPGAACAQRGGHRASPGCGGAQHLHIETTSLISSLLWLPLESASGSRARSNGPQPGACTTECMPSAPEAGSVRSRCCRATPAGMPREGLVPGPCGSRCVDVLVDGPSCLRLRLHRASPRAPLPRRPSSHEGAGRRVKGLPYSSASSLITLQRPSPQKGYSPKFQEGLCPVQVRGGLSTTLWGGVGQGRGWGPLGVCQPHKELWSHDDLRGLPS